MSAREEWGAWIEHDGKGCPVIGHIVECRWLQSDGAVRLRNYKG